MRAFACAVIYLSLTAAAPAAGVEVESLAGHSAFSQNPIRGPFTRVEADREASSTFLVVGVKSSLAHNFEQRQAIRETWGSNEQTRRYGVRVVFLGCSLDLSTFTDNAEQTKLIEGIAQEKRTFGDLLTDELQCNDSYFQLLPKVVRFLQWVVRTTKLGASGVQYVMVVDDDVYLRLDRIVQFLQNRYTPRTRFYGGYVLKHLQPVRDSAHKNYVPFRKYPLKTLPSFVGGPHYVMSMDIVEFLVHNSGLLKGIRALDDLSIALWLYLLLHVKAVHLPDFILLRSSECIPNASALADLSPDAIRLLHESVIANRSMCSSIHLESLRQRHRGIILPDIGSNDTVMKDPTGRVIESNTKLMWELVHDANSNSLQVRVSINVMSQAIAFVFIPSTTSYEEGLCGQAAALLYEKLYTTVDIAFCQHHRRALLNFVDSYAEESKSVRALVRLMQQNLAISAGEVKIIGISQGARYARILIECLLVEMFPNTRFRVFSEQTLVDTRTEPDFFVFSILDEAEHFVNSTVTYGTRFVNYFDETTQLIMISGEAWPVGGLDARVVLLSTVRSSLHGRHIYLPAASTTFAESIEHDPSSLLNSQPTNQVSQRRFCAYLYARCDHLAREYMFDLLNGVEPVNALGACQGARQAPITERLRSRYHTSFYTDEAVRLFSDYKFVIAFENTINIAGYVTEKIVTAFLAGAIPIYYGHSETVNQLFNRKAFINCGDFASLRACSKHVLAVHRSAAAYQEIRREPPIINLTVFIETFGWHPSVTRIAQGLTRNERSSTFVDQLKQLLGVPIKAPLRRV